MGTLTSEVNRALHEPLSRIFLVILTLLCFPSSGFAVQEGYYHLGNESLEFRLAFETLKEVEESGIKGWNESVDLKGREYFISPEVEIASGDIDGLLVEKAPFDDISYNVIIYFKKEVWRKIRNVTGRNIKRRVGIFRGSKLVSAPVLQEALENEANIVGLTNSTIDWFVRGFTLVEEPYNEKVKREQEREDYTDYLVKEVDRNPNDIDLQMRLASRYMFNSPKDYRKAAALYEKILKQEPSRGDILSLLADCYTSLDEYQKAIEILNYLLARNPADELTTRIQLAEVYQKWGQYDNSIKQLDQALELLNTSYQEHSNEWRDAIKSEIGRMKAKMVTPAYH